MGWLRGGRVLLLLAKIAVRAGVEVLNMGFGRGGGLRDLAGDSLGGDGVEAVEEDVRRIVEVGLTFEYTDEHGLTVSSGVGDKFAPEGDSSSSILSAYMVV
jgi:hypothetical protein